MARTTTLAIDGVGGTATLEIVANGVVETTYTYTNNIFTLSERLSDVTLSKSEVTVTENDIEGWYNGVVANIGCTYAWAAHSLDIDDKNTRVVYKLKFGDSNEIQAIHAILHKNNGSYEFKARSELTLTPHQFHRFVRTLKLILGQPIEGWIAL